MVNQSGDDTDLGSSDECVGSPEKQFGDGKKSLVGGTDSAMVSRPGTVEVGDDEISACSVEDPVETLRLYCLAAASADEVESDANELSDPDQFEHMGTNFDLADYAHELAFLSDLAEVVPTKLDYDVPNLKSICHTPKQYATLVEALRKHGADNGFEWKRTSASCLWCRV
ncbi:hypothetical protein PC121_g21255 [Phytophthora cactorum]|nr:hypothetical protein PC120_g23068 [Phytophthora cactorum]KAG3045451.1 hypothetical protein PC121_g21255 [Phytophthora cactorum]